MHTRSWRAMSRDMTRRIGLSKSRITAFEQCPRRLWLQVHAADLGAVDPAAQLRFANGHAVGAAACAIDPQGVMVEAEPDLVAALEMTAWLLAEGHPGPIFEATFEHDGVLVRADVLRRAGEGAWRMEEVKSSTRVKDYHLGDLATQVWVIEKAGVTLAQAGIAHVDTGFVLEREGDWRGLFAFVDLLDEARAMARGRAGVVAAARGAGRAGAGARTRRALFHPVPLRIRRALHPPPAAGAAMAGDGAAQRRWQALAGAGGG